MVWILSAVKRIQVTGHAFLGSALIDAILMTGRAGNRRMTPRQRELGRCRMVEGSARPGCGVMAVGAGLAKLCRFVIRIHRRRIIIQMTGNALLGCPLVHTILMTGRTRHGRMASCQRELRTG